MEERRTSLIADSTFQVRWIVQLVLGSFVLINVVLIVAFLMAGGGLDTPTERITLGVVVAVIELAGLFGVFYLARRDSSRIAGPLYRVTRIAEALRRGDLTVRASVRDADYFQDTLKELDRSLSELRSRLEELKTNANRAGQGERGAQRELQEGLAWFKTRADD